VSENRSEAKYLNDSGGQKDEGGPRVMEMNVLTDSLLNSLNRSGREQRDDGDSFSSIIELHRKLNMPDENQAVVTPSHCWETIKEKSMRSILDRIDLALDQAHLRQISEDDDTLPMNMSEKIKMKDVNLNINLNLLVSHSALQKQPEKMQLISDRNDWKQSVVQPGKGDTQRKDAKVNKQEMTVAQLIDEINSKFKKKPQPSKAKGTKQTQPSDSTKKLKKPEALPKREYLARSQVLGRKKYSEAGQTSIMTGRLESGRPSGAEWPLKIKNFE
jgi:hypothetical protein